MRPRTQGFLAPLDRAITALGWKDDVTLTINEAAAVLQVSPDTLQAWETRYGFPAQSSSRAGTRNYADDDLIALREALPCASSVASAIATARMSVRHDAQPGL
jgi:hypothetical protein